MAVKYKTINSKNEKIIKIKLPENGIDMYSDSNYAENMIFKNGRFETRKGLNANVENILDIADFEGVASADFKLTDTIFYKENKPFQIAYCDIDFDYSNRFFKVFLIDEDLISQNAGYIHFQRAADDIFYVPENIIFYTGKPQNGGGIFAVVLLKNLYNGKAKEAAIFEINEDFNSWSRVTEYYIPTVYINGRGNLFEFAEQTGQVCNKTPKDLENLNLLNGRFYAYYSSDGYSTSFRLPFLDITQSSVICRVYTSLDKFTEWQIFEGENSAEQEFFNTSVKMNVDREKGTVFFTAQAGDFAIPLMNSFKENNIRILAQTKTDASLLTIAPAKCSVMAGQDIYFSGCSDNNRIYYTSYDNPLYFPQLSDNYIGSADSSVNAICHLKDSLLIFKDREVYKAEIKHKKSLNTTALLTENGSIFYSVNSLNIKNISVKTGCSCKDSLAVTNNGCIWYTQGKIYKLSNSSNEIQDISKEILPFINSLSETEKESAFGICKGNFYILSLLSKAVIIDIENTAKYIYKLPDNIKIIGALKIADKAILCKANSGDFAFIGTLSGNKDTSLNYTYGQYNKEFYDIKSSFKLLNITLGNMFERQRIKGIYLNIEAESDVIFKISTATDSYEYNICSHKINNSKVKIFADIFCSSKIDFSFKSDCGFTIGDIDIYYTEV